MKKKNSDEQIKIPFNSEYDEKYGKSIDRRTEVRVEGDKVIFTRKYQIGGMTYTVNSIFDKDFDVNNNIKYLIARAMESEK